MGDSRASTRVPICDAGNGCCTCMASYKLRHQVICNALPHAHRVLITWDLARKCVQPVACPWVLCNLIAVAEMFKRSREGPNQRMVQLTYAQKCTAARSRFDNSCMLDACESQ